MLLSEQDRNQLEDDLEQQIGKNAFDAIEAAILAKLASAELPEPLMKTFRLGPMFTTEQMALRFAQGFAAGAAAQLAEMPTCWVTPDGEGFRMRLTKPVTDVPLGWDALYTRREA